MNRRSVLINAVAAGVTGLGLSAVNKAQAQTEFTAISGHQFQSAGQDYQLIDLISPVESALHPLARLHADRSRTVMQELLDQRDWRYVVEGAPSRWGIQNARAADLSEKLIDQGAALVLATSKNYQVIKRMFAAEAKARENRAGLWAVPFFRVRNANDVDDCDDAIGSVQVLQGSVKRVGKSSTRIYLNFGDDYRTDVTATITATLARRWAKDGLDVARLDDQIIRVRGYLEWINGPSMTIDHPMAIEILDADGLVMAHPHLINEETSAKNQAL